MYYIPQILQVKENKAKNIVSQHCKSLNAKHLTYKIRTCTSPQQDLFINLKMNIQRNRTSNNSSIDRIWANEPNKKQREGEIVSIVLE